jgi:protein-tyrosine-phosphatase
MSGRKFNVLFLCTGNSARSIMAEALLGRLGADNFNAYSAGSMPKGRVHPMAIRLLKEFDYEINYFRSKSWDEYSGPDAPHFDFIFTVCDRAASETCPLWPGHPLTAHWGIPDPDREYVNKEEEYQGFLDTYYVLGKRIEKLISLPIEELDKSSLKKHLDEIGKSNLD